MVLQETAAVTMGTGIKGENGRLPGRTGSPAGPLVCKEPPEGENHQSGGGGGQGKPVSAPTVNTLIFLS